MGRAAPPATDLSIVHTLTVSNQVPTESVGRDGLLDLTYARRGKDTILTQVSSRSPWHWFPPISLDEGSAYTLLVNPSGGLVGGDRLSVCASLGPKAHVLFSTPSANRVYRTLSEPAIQSVELTVGPGAIVEWVPEVTIPYRGSKFRQNLHVTLQEGATLLLWDALASGRVARGERWDFASVENEIRVTTASGGSLLERYRLDRPDQIVLAREWDYVASLFIIGEGIEEDTWKQLEADLGEILDQSGDTVLGGVSEPAIPGLAVKLVARSAPALNDLFSALWAAARSRLWNRPLPELRRY